MDKPVNSACVADECFISRHAKKKKSPHEQRIHRLEQGLFGLFETLKDLVTKGFQCVKVHISNLISSVELKNEKRKICHLVFHLPYMSIGNQEA